MDARAIWSRYGAGFAAVLLGLAASKAMATPSTLPVQWSFEDDPLGTVYVDQFGVGIQGWEGDSSTSAVAFVSAEDYSGQYTGDFPIVGTHTNVLTVEARIQNVFDTPPLAADYTNVVIDLMVRAGHLSFEPQLDGTPQMAAYVNTNGQLVVYHAYFYNANWDSSNAWSELSHDFIGSNDWFRLTITMDYLTSEYDQYEHFFEVAINGGAALNGTLAYDSRQLLDPIPVGGTWFLTADSGYAGQTPNSFLTALEIQGVGALDDIVLQGVGMNNPGGLTPFQIWMNDNNVTDQFGDDDSDGADNWTEYLSGTDPNDPASVFKVVAQKLENGTNWIYWLSGSGSSVSTDFMVYRATDLGANSGQGNWELVGSNITRNPLPGTNMWGDSNPPEVPAYYQPRLPASE